MVGLTEVLDRAASVLTKVDWPNFRERFKEELAVQHFYQPFLKEFDPELRKQLGVWYTPPEIVKYMVARVDTVLREELGCRDGLADPKVFVLDPCCGTGSFLVEVLERIHETLKKKGGNGLLAADLKEAAMKRVFGFEILPAPFVVAHLQLGLLLDKKDAPLAEKGERVGVYLTNALTGWEPPKEPKKKLPFPELEQEREAADRIKRESRIWVVLGNPPYYGFAGVATGEESTLIQHYKTGLFKKWGIRRSNLNDRYIRFFGLAERCVAEMNGKGIVCFISNHSWVSEQSFVVLRESLLGSFDKFWLENMHGDRKKSEYAPDGRTSETIFAIPGFSSGIQQGVVISLWAKGEERKGPSTVLFRNDLDSARAAERRSRLLASLVDDNSAKKYGLASPSIENRFSFRPSSVSPAYRSWPEVESLADFKPSLGILENRDEKLFSIDLQPLEQRMQAYLDPSLEWADFVKLKVGLSENLARFDARKAREKLLAHEVFSEDAIRPLMVRPMDKRFCYYSRVRPLWNEPRLSYVEQAWSGNFSIATRRKSAANPEGKPFFLTSCIGFQHAIHTDAYYIPVRWRKFVAKKLETHVDQRELLAGSAYEQGANLSLAARKYLSSLGIDHPDVDSQRASCIWMHCLSVGYSPLYVAENSPGIREDWPRIPLPNSKGLLEASARLGEQVAALLDTEAPVEGVTSGDIREELRSLGMIRRIAKAESADPKESRSLASLGMTAGEAQLQNIDLAVTAGWGHGGKGGITMPGKGKLYTRDYSATEQKAIAAGAKRLGLSEKEAVQHLGEKTYDVYLNDVACWCNVPQRVWEYAIGGYQVIKKWLSYREEKLLGRPLTKDEARYVQEMVRRIAAICLLEPALDANYRAVKENTYPWKAQ